MVDVFISYSRSTRAKVEPIKQKLDALGLDCFFDMHQIDGGANFPDVIDRALRDSKAVLCCWSPAYFKGQWSMIECRDALARRIIVPVAIHSFEQFAPPADLRQINWFDLVEWTGEDDYEDWIRTLQNLGKLVGRDLVMSARTNAGATLPTSPDAPVATAAMQIRAELLADLRTTWAAFPAKSDIASVERFLERVREAVAGSGFEFEIEHHLEGLQNEAKSRVEKAERAAAARQAQLAAEAEARRLTQLAWRQSGAVWRDTIPGIPEDTVPEMVTMPCARYSANSSSSADIPTEQDGSEKQVLAIETDDCFALGKFPVTFADLDAAIAVGADLEWPNDQGLGRDRLPAINVNWHDAKAYIAWLNNRLGLTGCADAYRLPSEMEWVHVNNAGPANACGLNNVDGCLSEWCENRSNVNLTDAERSADGSPWLAGDSETGAQRGGPGPSQASITDLKARLELDPTIRRTDIGFRLARTLIARGAANSE